MDDDTEGDISSTDDPKFSLIPNGPYPPYPLITEGTGVGSQALPIPTGEYDEYSGESGGLLDGGVRKAKIW